MLTTVFIFFFIGEALCQSSTLLTTSNEGPGEVSGSTAITFASTQSVSSSATVTSSASSEPSTASPPITATSNISSTLEIGETATTSSSVSETTVTPLNTTSYPHQPHPHHCWHRRCPYGFHCEIIPGRCFFGFCTEPHQRCVYNCRDRGEIWEKCPSCFQHQVCGEPPQMCPYMPRPSCRPGCVCRPGLIRNRHGRCIPRWLCNLLESGNSTTTIGTGTSQSSTITSETGETVTVSESTSSQTITSVGSALSTTTAIESTTSL